MNLKKVVSLNRKEDLGCRILVIGLGEKYDSEKITEYATQNSDITYLHAKPSEIDVVLSDWFKNLDEETQ